MVIDSASKNAPNREDQGIDDAGRQIKKDLADTFSVLTYTTQQH
jgi:hypothetical protein